MGQFSVKKFINELDLPTLKPLPLIDYEYKEFKLLKVDINYHISLEKSYYSVPYQLVNKKVEVWFSNKIVDIYYEGKKVATHPKSSKKGKYFTLSEHMASAHKKYLESNIYCFSILLNLSINIFILYFTLFNI